MYYMENKVKHLNQYIYEKCHENNENFVHCLVFTSNFSLKKGSGCSISLCYMYSFVDMLVLTVVAFIIAIV